jgi:hypothetical protein
VPNVLGTAAMPFQEFSDRLSKFGDKTVAHSRTESGRGATVLSRSRSILRAVAEPFHVLPLGKAMQTFESTDSKSRETLPLSSTSRQKTTVTVEGSRVTGLVRSVIEVQSSNPRRWLITVIAKSNITA